MESPLKFVEAHPIATGVGVFIVGLGILFLMRSSGGGSQGSTDASLGAAYYAALAAQSHDSTALAIAQTEAISGTAQAQIGADAATHIQDTWAATNVATTIANDNAAIAAAPYAAESHLFDTLAEIATSPPVATTSSNSGFLGIGASSRTTISANPNAAIATNFLTDYLNGNHAAH